MLYLSVVPLPARSLLPSKKLRLKNLLKFMFSRLGVGQGVKKLITPDCCYKSKPFPILLMFLQAARTESCVILHTLHATILHNLHLQVISMILQ